jgi:iron complex transport system substrate-binding protein
MKKWWGLLAIAAVLGLSACSQAPAESSRVSVKSTQSAKVDSTEPTKYKRVVVSTGTIAQYLAALKVPVVGVPQEDNIPTTMKKLPSVGQPRHINMEKVISLHPDLFVGDAAMQNMTKDALAKQRITTTYLDNMSYDKVVANIQQLGKMFGRQKQATAIVTKIQKNEAQAVAGAASLKDKKVVILFGTGENFMVATKNSYMGSLLAKLGVHNIADDLVHAPTPYMPISMESVVAKNPDYILTLAHGHKEAATAAFKEEMAKPLWNSTTAHQQKQIYALDDQTFPVTGNIHADTTLTKLKDLLLHGQ